MRYLLCRYSLFVVATLLPGIPAVLACSQIIVPFPDNLKRSRLVVVGKVIEVRGDQGRRVAVFDIHETLKGNPPSSRLELPFREKVDGPCSEKVEYQLGAAHLLLYSGNAAAAEHYPRRFDATPGRTADNIRSGLRILETDDLDQKKALYRSVFESTDRVFLKDALDGLKRLRGDDAVLVENVLLGALSAGARGEDDWMVAELVRLRSRRAVPLLAALASGRSDPEIRRAAIDGLGRLEARDAVRGLRDLAERETDAAVRKKAIESLARIEGNGVAEFLKALHSSEQDPALRGFVLEQLAATGHTAAAELATEALDSKALEERQGAYRAVGRLRLREMFPVLARRLQSGAAKPDIPWIAAALVEVDPAAAAPHLIPLLAGGAARSMLDLLGRTGSDAARKALLDFMQRDLSAGGARSPMLLEPILELGGDDAAAAVLDLVRHPNPYLRSRAIRALGKFRVAAAFAPIAALMDSANDMDPAEALLQIAYERALPLVLDWLARDDRRSVPGAFIERRDRRALDLIERRIRAMPDSEQRDMLARAAEAIRAGP